jgi:DNA replication and repair protein RecF
MGTSEIRPSVAEEADVSASLGRLSFRDFRNFESLELEFPPAGVVIIGPNGSGKTNLLEGIYYLDIFRSFRGANDRELVRFGADVFRIEAELREGEDRRRLAAAYQRTGSRKKVERDGHQVDRFSDAIGTLGAVVFSLDDVEIVRGSPGERRRFLDILLSLVETEYVSALGRYRKVLSQRNEALKEGAGPAVLEPWTEELVEMGGRIMSARSRWVRRYDEAFGRYNARVAGGATARMRYEPSVGLPEDLPELPSGRLEVHDREARRVHREPWETRFHRALEESAERERRRGVTVVGPHRDDMALRAVVDRDEEPRDLRTYGSGGQQRTAALALRLVESDTLARTMDREPIYLLDDVFAELDRDRSTRLMELLDEGRTGQAILTAPKAGDLGLREGTLEQWRIRDGEVITA